MHELMELVDSIIRAHTSRRGEREDKGGGPEELERDASKKEVKFV